MCIQSVRQALIHLLATLRQWQDVLCNCTLQRSKVRTTQHKQAARGSDVTFA
jgi:hypothetical protein